MDMRDAGRIMSYALSACATPLSGSILVLGQEHQRSNDQLTAFRLARSRARRRLVESHGNATASFGRLRSSIAAKWSAIGVPANLSLRRLANRSSELRGR